MRQRSGEGDVDASLVVVDCSCDLGTLGGKKSQAMEVYQGGQIIGSSTTTGGRTPVGPWSGVWTQTLSGASGTPLYLIQRKGSVTVTGWYAFCDATILGTVHGKGLTGAWKQKFPCGGAAQGSGRFAFGLAPSGKSFTGTWGYGTIATNAHSAVNAWSGKLQHR